MNEDKAARYHRLRRRAVVLGSVWTLSLLAGLLLTGASEALRNAVSTLTATLPVPWVSLGASALFGLVIWCVHELLALPIALYLGFTLERRYGLSRQKLGHWMADQARASVLSLVIFVVGVAGVYETVRFWPAGWWLVVWLAGVAVSVCLAWLAPVVLMPLFFRFTPIRNDALRQRLADLSSRAGAPVLDIFEWRLSDRTRRGMAALTGLGSTRRIIVSDTLVADYSPDEIEVVLAHELAHHVHRDGRATLALDAAVLGVALWTTSLLMNAVAPTLGLEGPSDLAGLPLLLIAALGWWWLTVPVVNAVSRAHERRADTFALELTQKPEAFVSAMRRLATQNLAEESPAPFARLFFSTHPPFDERLARARAWKHSGP